jgi:hypothetical protein
MRPLPDLIARADGLEELSADYVLRSAFGVRRLAFGVHMLMLQHRRTPNAERAT